MKRLASAGLTLLIVAMAAIALAMVVVPAVAGVRAFTIDRNSMQREISLGSLEYSQAQPDYNVGDTVVFQINGNTVTHKIVAVLPNPATAALDGTLFSTQGVENLEPDPWQVPKDHIIGKVIWHAPLVGIATKLVATPTVAIFLLLIAGGLWWASTSPSKQPPPASHRVDGVEEEVVVVA